MMLLCKDCAWCKNFLSALEDSSCTHDKAKYNTSMVSGMSTYYSCQTMRTKDAVYDTCGEDAVLFKSKTKWSIK